MWASTLVVAVAAVIYTSIVSNGSIDIVDVDKQLIMTLIRYINEICPMHMHIVYMVVVYYICF